MGLYDKAHEFTVSSNENPNPKYEILSDDEIWFVIDTDSWGSKIEELIKKC